MEKNKVKSVKKYVLDYDKAHPYFIDHIGCGKTLSELVVKNISFQKGQFYTFLPENAITERLYELRFGGMIPTNVYDSNGELIGTNPPGSKPDSDVTTIQILSAFIKTYLSKSPSRCAVVEDFIGRGSTSVDHIGNIRVIPYEDEVYYFLNSTNSITELEKTILYSEEVWHSLVILTTIENCLGSELLQPELDHIIENTSFIIISAYDGEGYVFWEKIEN